MGLADCIKCWDANCSCGWDYRHWEIERLKNRRNIFNKIIEFKTQNPNAKFSNFLEKETEDDKRFAKFMEFWIIKC